VPDPAKQPATVRYAAILVGIEGIAALIMVVVLGVRGFAGGDAKVAFGTAGWFAIIGAAVLAAAWALWSGRRWGRGIAVFTQLLLLPVTWYIAVGSHQWRYGVPIAIVALGVLVLMFSPSALQWLSAQDPEGPDDPEDPEDPEVSEANADNSEPDTR
jgi:peptidoglycan/LPS O-acetylase OafA/YrhL